MIGHTVPEKIMPKMRPTAIRLAVIRKAMNAGILVKNCKSSPQNKIAPGVRGNIGRTKDVRYGTSEQARKGFYQTAGMMWW